MILLICAFILLGHELGPGCGFLKATRFGWHFRLLSRIVKEGILHLSGIVSYPLLTAVRTKYKSSIRFKSL
jgi:hypothetical protein